MTKDPPSREATADRKWYEAGKPLGCLVKSRLEFGPFGRFAIEKPTQGFPLFGHAAFATLWLARALPGPKGNHREILLPPFIRVKPVLVPCIGAALGGLMCFIDP